MTASLFHPPCPLDVVAVRLPETLRVSEDDAVVVELVAADAVHPVWVMVHDHGSAWSWSLHYAGSAAPASGALAPPDRLKAEAALEAATYRWAHAIRRLVLDSEALNALRREAKAA